MDNNEDCEACWICLEGAEGTDTRPGPLHANRLIRPCRCPRVVHSVCLAKWQLSQSGKSEEKFCRFCKERLPDWQENLALPGMAAVEPVMSVHFNGQTHMVKVKPGEEGRLAFIQDVRRLLRLRENQEFSITFECKVPGHGMFLDLKGLSSYDAAVFCAAMTAVERQRLAAQKAQKAAAATQSSDPLATFSGPSLASATLGHGAMTTAGAAAGSANTGAGRASQAATRSSSAGGRGASARRTTRGSNGGTSSDADVHQMASSLAASDSDGGNSSRANSIGGAGHSRSQGSVRAATEGSEPTPAAAPTTLGSQADMSASTTTTAQADRTAGRRSTSGTPGAGAVLAGAAEGAPREAATGRNAAAQQQQQQQQREPHQQGHGACEVEPAGVAGVGVGNDGATIGPAAVPAGAAEGAADRRKLHRHGWHVLALGGGPGGGALAANAAAGAGTTGVAECGTGGLWLSRLFLCRGFRGAVYEPAH